MNLPAVDFESFVATVGTSPHVEIAIAPPFPFLTVLRSAAAPSGYRLAAQNASEHASGAFTGEVSTSMLRTLGVEYVIVGHSERRSLYGETDTTIGRKIRRVLEEGLKPLFCVGEKQEVRDAGGTEALLERQLREALSELHEPPDELVVAYEPVWAIGTGRTATPQMASDAHRFIRNVIAQLLPSVSLRIQYGGSVTPDNAAELSGQEGIDGFLVGGASLDGEKFRRIVEAMEGVVAIADVGSVKEAASSPPSLSRQKA